MNPLSRERLEAALNDLPEPNIDDPWHWYLDNHETIKTALVWLLNPEPTDEMIEAGVMTYGNDQTTETIFKAMIKSLTAETP